MYKAVDLLKVARLRLKQSAVLLTLQLNILYICNANVTMLFQSLKNFPLSEKTTSN